MARTKLPAVKGQLFIEGEAFLVLRPSNTYTSNDHRRLPGEKQAAKARVVRGSGVVKPKQAAKWDDKLANVKEWLRKTGQYPKEGSSDKVEAALGTWLRHNLPGANSYRPERWAKLNDAFGWGWEFVFSPRFGRR